MHLFSSTLRVARFGGCSFPDADGGSNSMLRLPLLNQLSLLNVAISESSLRSLLDGCPVLESLLLAERTCSCIQIISGTLKSIGLQSGSGGTTMLQELIIEDAPLLERFIFVGTGFSGVVVSIISAPKLGVLGNLPVNGFILKFGTEIIFLIRTGKEVL
ncbi:hypothetical protein PR202_gb12557 [Eleusine coracana subsp. coracana]|uniref:F-box/LRR-repeat protein 15/At3g58940/PEG3-like LRR domain-containing protein n=1 Tax=Eleusine coracana subsp. coracana TaxID=191504 RepID=A0AAV5EQS0_ELECO|nr:hypothetical protein PR202_gb12557 [Eleusine coracana subsp. coracana]